jgi:ubiquinone biosynthesis protein
MQTRPELLLLQKTMVVVEGVGRTLDPELNMWQVSEPVVKEWLESQLGTTARIAGAAEGAATVGRFMTDVPKLLGQVERVGEAFAEMAEEGLRLDDHSIERLAEAQTRQNRWNRVGIWVCAIALVLIAVSLF